VAIHPGDPRAAELVGRQLRLPILGRTIPIIADAYVDPEFGSGMVKITPAHDANDFQVGRRHGLEMPVVIDPRPMNRSPAHRLTVRRPHEVCPAAGGGAPRRQLHTRTRRARSLRHHRATPSSGSWHAAARRSPSGRRGDACLYPERWRNVPALDATSDWCICRLVGHRILPGTATRAMP
jgi:valyl-tRNA synthetase